MKKMMLVAIVGLFAGCSDPGAPFLEKCQDSARTGHTDFAVALCQRASERAAWWSGTKREADTRIVELRAKQETEKKQARQKVEQKAANDASWAALAVEAKKVVTRQNTSGGRDRECLGVSLPPFRYDYGGGTNSQNHAVALADGCQLLYPNSPMPLGSGPYCCPQ